MSRFCPPFMELCIVCVLWACIPISGFVADFLSVVHYEPTIEAAIAWCVDPTNSPDIVDHEIADMPISDLELFVNQKKVHAHP